MTTRTYPSGIVGLPYPNDVGTICREVARELLATGDTVTLKRDADNPHDPDAIGVYAADGRELRHCGFVPKRHAIWIGEALDTGQPIEATVGALLEERGVLKGVDLEITLTR